MDALLVGHEDWVFSAAWQPQLVAGSAPCLLTASMDRTMMLWRPEPSAGAHCLNLNSKAARTEDMGAARTDLAESAAGLGALQVLHGGLQLQ